MSKKKSTKEFIKNCYSVHDDKYDYSKVEYINAKQKVCIICPEHGEFWQTPSTHLRGGGCPVCAKNERSKGKRLNTDTFKKRAVLLNGNKYDYSKVEYVNCRTKVCIICPEHGEFWQVPYYHLDGSGCPECAKENRQTNYTYNRTTDDFIKECKKKYGDRYDFSNVEYKGVKEKITIYDNENKEYIIVTPNDLLFKNFKGQKRLTSKNFVEECRKIYGNKYDYSNTVYVNSKTKITFKCPIHGEIKQLPTNHLRYGCRFCSYDMNASKQSKSLEDFINEANSVHGDKYNYSKVKYINTHTKVCIICPEHGEFWQTPSKHLCFRGCPKCQRSYLEEKTSLMLNEKKISYIEQYSPSFLKNGKGKLKIDFYLPDHNIAIECQGEQHFKDFVFGEKPLLDKNIKRDIMKKERCEANNITMLYYTDKKNEMLIKHFDIYNKNNTFFDLNNLLSCIENIN